MSWLAWLQPAPSRLLSVAGPWFLRLQCCGPGKGPALGSWARRSLCPGPQYYHVSLLLETAETGLLAKAGTTQLSLPCQLSRLLQGTQGGGQQDQVNQLEPHVPRGPDGHTCTARCPLQPRRRHRATLAHQDPREPLGKNTGAGCHFLLPGGSFQRRARTHISYVSCIGRQASTTWEPMPFVEKGT